MAESKSKSSTDSNELVAISPYVVWRSRDDSLVHTLEGGRIPKDAVDPDHLKMLLDEGHVGTPKEAEKAAQDDES